MGSSSLAISRGTKVLVLTGAGISAESGVRTFRDAGGLWENHRVEEVASPYAAVEMDRSPVQRTPQGFPSVVVGGHGTGPGDAIARFMVITIQGPGGNQAIIVNFSPDAQPLAALPALREIIASYRISTA